VHYICSFILAALSLNAALAAGPTVDTAFAETTFPIGPLAQVDHRGQVMADAKPIAPVLDTFTLDNGFRVVSIPIANAKKTTVMVWYGVGSADDPPDRPGLAHYTEHATFRALGSHQPESTQSRRHFDGDIAGQPEAFTSFDYTAYYHIVQSNQLDSALQLEANRLSNLNVDNAAVEAERQEVLDERKHDIDGEPHALLEEEMQADLFANGPYETPIVASEFETNQISANDVNAFLDRWYAPNNAVLIVSGDLDVQSLRQQVKDRFDRIAPREVPKRKRPKPKPLDSVDLALEFTSTSSTQWARTYLAPSFATADNREVESLQILATLLADGDKGRLHSKLVDELRLANEIFTEYEPDTLGDTSFAIHAVLSDDADVLAFEKALEDELFKLTTAVFSEAELTAGLDHALSDLAVAWRDPYEAANLVGAALVTGRSLGEVTSLARTNSTIGPEDLRRAAIRVFATDHAITGIARAFVN